MTTYKLDDRTFEHLTAWCERETRDADEAMALREQMITYLESVPVEDAEYSLSHGWPHVRSLAEGFGRFSDWTTKNVKIKHTPQHECAGGCGRMIGMHVAQCWRCRTRTAEARGL